MAGSVTTLAGTAVERWFSVRRSRIAAAEAARHAAEVRLDETLHDISRRLARVEAHQ